MRAARVTDIYNYLRIDDKLATSGQPVEEELAAAARDGVEVVINLALHDDPRYSLADEPGTVQNLGMKYIHIPVQFDAPAEAELEEFFQVMDENAGRRILVHCAANKRVTAFIGLYRAIRTKLALDRAFEPMKKIWDPNPIWAAFIEDMLKKHQP